MNSLVLRFFVVQPDTYRCFYFLCTKWTVEEHKGHSKLGTKDLSLVKVNVFRISNFDYFCSNEIVEYFVVSRNLY